MVLSNPSQITASWLTDVLRVAGVIGDAAVVEIVCDQVGAGVGLMGELTRTRLTYDRSAPGAPTSVVVKTTSPFESNRQQGIGLGMYAAEIRFYNELASRASMRTPRCFHAEYDSVSGDFVVVLEDLSGHSAPDQLAGLSLTRAELAVTALADLHAAFWGRSDDIDWVASVVHERIQGLAQVWPALWEGFSSRFADRLPEGAIDAGERIRDQYWELMCLLGERPWTLIHQDFRCDNMFFESVGGGEELIVLDWQAIGRGPGAYDLAYVLAGSLTIDDRRAHEERLVRRYHERLVERGVSYGFDDLWVDYRLSHLVNTSVAVITGGTMDLANERGRELVATLGQRHFTAVLDLQSVDLIPARPVA